MSDDLRIDFEWLGRQGGSAVDRAFYADIGLAVNDQWLTQLEDQEASTVRTHLRGCAHRLALWIAGNWWRLRWEPEVSDWLTNTDWRIAHSMASAGGGYVWPNIIFASNGESLTIASRPSRKTPAFEPVRYLNEIDARVSAVEFERKVDSFMAAMISRQSALSIEDKSLPEIWEEVLDERRDPTATTWRKLEALCGYDPDEAPAEFMEQLLAEEKLFGQNAVEEVAAQARREAGVMLSQVRSLVAKRGAPTKEGFRGRLPVRPTNWKNVASGQPPWRRAAVIAKQARERWGFGLEPISDGKLGELLNTPASTFSKASRVETPIPVAIRRGSNVEVDLFFHSLRSTGRRFAAARLLGDHLSSARNELLIPETDAKTSRQQFQRAFAQEFLCPFDALRAMIDPAKASDADFENAADHFRVSPLLVKTTLVNRGELDRDALISYS